MTLPHIIGVTGNARHGKDTVAEYLSVRYGYSRYALAEPLKTACSILFDWTPQEMSGESKDTIDPRYGISPRQALQSLGTEWGQFGLSRYPEFKARTGRRLWVNRLLARSSGEPLVVVSDVRFPHEADAILEAGGQIVMVYRDSVPVDTRHESERAVLDIRPDYVLDNCGSIEDLQRKVDAMMHKWMNE